MSTEFLRTVNGSLIAVIRTGGDGFLRIYLPNETLRGVYHPHSNITYAPNGSMIGRGNLLASLVL